MRFGIDSALPVTIPRFLGMVCRAQQEAPYVEEKCRYSLLAIRVGDMGHADFRRRFLYAVGSHGSGAR